MYTLRTVTSPLRFVLQSETLTAENGLESQEIPAGHAEKKSRSKLSLSSMVRRIFWLEIH